MYLFLHKNKFCKKNAKITFCILILTTFFNFTNTTIQSFHSILYKTTDVECALPFRQYKTLLIKPSRDNLIVQQEVRKLSDKKIINLIQ